VSQDPEDWGEALQICVDLITTRGKPFDTAHRRESKVRPAVLETSSSEEVRDLI
jgi:hypothetical protein